MNYVLYGRYTVTLINYGSETKIAIVGDGNKIFRTINNNVLDFMSFLVDNGCSKIEKVYDEDDNIELLKVTFEIDESKIVDKD